jgi:type IV pilus biogenesis protein CpaD/CtpE
VALNPLEWLKAVRAIDRLLSLEEKHTTLIEAQAKELQSLKDQVTELKAREAVLIAEARGAAAAAAAAVASQHVADLARRIGAMDERMRQFGKLSPPERVPDSD